MKRLNENLPSERMPELDGMRAILSIGVLIHHFNPNGYLPASDHSIYGALNKFLNIFSVGSIGVIFFFVLSAFVLTISLKQELKMTDRLDIFSFYCRRAFRLWPLYFLAIMITFLLPAVFTGIQEGNMLLITTLIRPLITTLIRPF